MNRVHSRTLAFAASLSLGTAAVAAPPLNLDTEQKATAAFVTGLNVSHSSTINHYGTIERVIFYSNRALQKAASVTAPCPSILRAWARSTTTSAISTWTCVRCLAACKERPAGRFEPN
jgi:hypothetical protein